MDPLDKTILESIFQADEHGCLPKDENNYIEYKQIFDSSSREAQVKYAKELAGLCNCDGGYLIFGVEDNTKKLIGLKNFNSPGNAHLIDVLSNYFATHHGH